MEVFHLFVHVRGTLHRQGRFADMLFCMHRGICSMHFVSSQKTLDRDMLTGRARGQGTCPRRRQARWATTRRGPASSRAGRRSGWRAAACATRCGPAARARPAFPITGLGQGRGGRSSHVQDVVVRGRAWFPAACPTLSALARAPHQHLTGVSVGSVRHQAPNFATRT